MSGKKIKDDKFFCTYIPKYYYALELFGKNILEYH